MFVTLFQEAPPREASAAPPPRTPASRGRDLARRPPVPHPFPAVGSASRNICLLGPCQHEAVCAPGGTVPGRGVQAGPSPRGLPTPQPPHLHPGQRWAQPHPFGSIRSPCLSFLPPLSVPLSLSHPLLAWPSPRAPNRMTGAEGQLRARGAQAARSPQGLPGVGAPSCSGEHAEAPPPPEPTVPKTAHPERQATETPDGDSPPSPRGLGLLYLRVLSAAPGRAHASPGLGSLTREPSSRPESQRTWCLPGCALDR